MWLALQVATAACQSDDYRLCAPCRSCAVDGAAGGYHNMAVLDACALHTLQVLSVETALSIQSHPDKALAQRLHAERPQARVPPHSPATSPLCLSCSSLQLVTSQCLTQLNDDMHVTLIAGEDGGSARQ